MMENAEEIMHSLEEFSKLKPKVIPRELEDYLGYVAKSGDPVFKWSLVKFLFREKMLSVINDFYEDTLTIELPPCPNVDPFNYDRMKSNLLERLESFHGAPFTIQRICELLTNPRKEYNRADKFMRAIAKNVLVVSTREPGRFSELDCETTQECSINGIREVGDSLDSTFIINDLGPGPDSSSPSSDLNDSMSDTNHLTSIERVSPVHDQEISSDSDDNSLENGQISVDRPPDKLNGLESEHSLSLDDNTVSNVTSTDMTLTLESNNLSGIHCDETTGNSVTSSHESIISNQQIGFAIGPSLGEVMGSVEGSPVENLEPCILPDGSLLNEVINQHESAAAKGTGPSECVSLVSKSDELHTPGPLIDEPDDASPKSITETVECDTSQTDRSSKCDDGAENLNGSLVVTNEAHCDINEQVSSCDTTDSINALVSGYNPSSSETHASQSEILTITSLEQTPSDDIIQSEVMSQSVVEASTNLAQSDVIDQSDVELSNSDQSEGIAQSDGISSPNIISNSDFLAQSDVVAQSDSDMNIPADTVQSEVIAQSDEDIVAESNTLAHSDTSSHLEVLAQSDLIDQSDSGLSDPDHSEVSDSNVNQTPAASVETLQADISSQSTFREQIDAENEVNTVVQSCTVATSEDVAVAEPMTQSSIDDESDCNVPDPQVQLPDQTQSETVIRMDIPCESENMADPAHSIQPDSVTSEPMDVDE